MVEGDVLVFGDDVFEAVVAHAAVAEADHLAELFVFDHMGGVDTVATREDAVEGGGFTAALDVAEGAAADFLVREALFDSAGEVGADTAVADGIRAVGDEAVDDGVSVFFFGALGDDDDCGGAAVGVSVVDFVEDFIDRERDFGDEDEVGGTGDACFEGDPAGAATHDFGDHDAMMGFGGGVEAAEVFGDDVDGGVESEGDVSGGEVVVDGFWDADDVDAFSGEIAGAGECAVAAEDDKGVDAFFSHVFDGDVADVFFDY